MQGMWCRVAGDSWVWAYETPVRKWDGPKQGAGRQQRAEVLDEDVVGPDHALGVNHVCLTVFPQTRMLKP